MSIIYIYIKIFSSYLVFKNCERSIKPSGQSIKCKSSLILQYTAPIMYYSFECSGSARIELLGVCALSISLFVLLRYVFSSKDSILFIFACASLNIGLTHPIRCRRTPHLCIHRIRRRQHIGSHIRRRRIGFLDGCTGIHRTRLMYRILAGGSCHR